MLRKGNVGPNVANAQILLNKNQPPNQKPLVEDGIFGRLTELAVRQFQQRNGLRVDGIIGPNTMQKLNASPKLERPNAGQRFAVFNDAGHGGLDRNLVYQTAGKFAIHKGLNLHVGNTYYEGVFNRNLSEEFNYLAGLAGLRVVNLHCPIKDLSLADRREIVREYLEAGYWGYTQSLHSNAISLRNSVEVLRKTRGFCVFTLPGQSIEDKFATYLFEGLKAEFPQFPALSQTWIDGDPDWEKKLGILRAPAPAFLLEFLFHTSELDVKELIKPEIIKRVAQTLLTVALQIRDRHGDELKRICA